jgi:hypothetical protein
MKPKSLWQLFLTVKPSVDGEAGDEIGGYTNLGVNLHRETNSRRVGKQLRPAFCEVEVQSDLMRLLSPPGVCDFNVDLAAPIARLRRIQLKGSRELASGRI